MLAVLGSLGCAAPTGVPRCQQQGKKPAHKNSFILTSCWTPIGTTQKPWFENPGLSPFPLKANFVAFIDISRLKLQNMVKISPLFI